MFKAKQQEELTPTTGIVVVFDNLRLVLCAPTLLEAKKFAGGQGRVVLSIIEPEKPFGTLSRGKNHSASLDPYLPGPGRQSFRFLCRSVTHDGD